MTGKGRFIPTGTPWIWKSRPWSTATPRLLESNSDRSLRVHGNTTHAEERESCPLTNKSFLPSLLFYVNNLSVWTFSSITCLFY